MRLPRDLIGQPPRPGRCLLNTGDGKLVTVTVPAGQARCQPVRHHSQVMGNSRGQDRGHINVGRRVANPRDRALQAGFRERDQSLGYPRGNRGRLVPGAPSPRCGGYRRLYCAVANSSTAALGVLGAEHGGQQSRRVDAGGVRERCRRYPQQDHDRVPVLIPGQCPEVAEPVGGGTIAHRVPLADQFSPQLCSPFRIAAYRVQQQRPAKAACSAALAMSSASIASVGQERLIGRAVQLLLSLLLLKNHF